MDRKFPSEKELFDGKCEDGSKPPLYSREMYTGPTKPWSKEPAVPPVADVVETEQEKTADRMHYEIDLQLMSDLDLAASFGRELVEMGRAAMREPETSVAGGTPVAVEVADAPEAAGAPGTATATTTATTTATGEAPVPRNAGVPPARDEDARSSEPLDASSLATPEQRKALDNLNLETGVSELPKEPYKFSFGKLEREGGAGSLPADPPSETSSETNKPAEPASDAPATEDRGGQTGTRARSGHRQADATPRRKADAPEKPLTRAQRIAMGERGAKILIAVAPKRAEIAHKLVAAATKLDIRKAFMEDRAIAAVKGLLLHLDKEWVELGFGAWMPFRWPDQWLSFCGLLTRVLAANGLIHAKHADTYRKLLDETPPVALKGTVHDRVKETKTPLNPALCKRFQGAETMSHLKTRLQNEVWGPKEKWRKDLDDYWEKEHGIKPPP